MLEIFAKVGLINCIVAVFLMMQLFLKAKRDLANWTFNLLALSIAFWSFGYWQWLNVQEAVSALFWVRAFTVASILIPLTYFFWIVCLTNAWKRYLLHLVGLFLLAITLIYNTFSTDLIVSGLQSKLIFPFWPQAGALYTYYVLFLYVGVVSLSLIILYTTYRKTKDENLKNQIRYIFWGSLIGFGGGITNFFLWYNILVPPYFNFLVGVGLIMFYYAASKHSLFHIKVIATEFFAYILSIALLFRLVFASNFQDRIIDAVTLVLVSIVVIQLFKSVKIEVEQREQLEKLDKELEAANVQLKSLDKARAEFISIASHQLRTPPATIKWYLAAILGGDFGPVPDKVKKAVLTAEMTNNSQISTIDDLLNASRIERGKMEFVFEPTDIVKITQITVDQLTPQALQRKQKLVFTPPTVQLPLITADKEKIRQVINNFIDNSIKYTPAEGAITVSIEKTAKDIVVKVKDSGKGISKQNLAGVFEKYNRGGNKTDSQGLGLGLYVAKVVVEQHNGKIWAESAGEGKVVGARTDCQAVWCHRVW
jgi:signal transduction histidine kinase